MQDPKDTAVTFPRQLEERLVKAFTARGHIIYVVGGTVRDRILGREPLDLDFATTASVQESKQLLASLKPTAVYSIGEKFGTVAALFDGIKVEVTTFRKPHTLGGQPAQGATIEEDLAHRDFTINAVAWDPLDRKLLDPHHGLPDLKHRVIRAVGNPTERLLEDPIRILRAVRLACELEFSLDADLVRACKNLAPKLREVAAERIGEEMGRLVTTTRPSVGIRALDEISALSVVLPELSSLKHAEEDRNKYKDIFEHTLRVVDRTPAILPLRWAALLHDVGKPLTRVIQDDEVTFFGHERVGADMARQILRRLKQSQALADKVARLVLLHTQANSYQSQWTDAAVRRLLREAGDDIYLLLELSKADVTSYRPARVRAAAQKVEELRARIANILEQEDLKKLKSPLDGNELMELFALPPGPWIRVVKEYLLNLVIDGQLSQGDKDEARELAREFLRTHAEELGVSPKLSEEESDLSETS